MSELFPTKTIALEYVDCTDPKQEYEFNRWYNKVHVPDLLTTKGIRGVSRYRNLARELREGQARYLTLYRLDTNDPVGVMQQVAADNARRAAQGRTVEFSKTYEVNVWNFLVYRSSLLPRQRPNYHLPDGMPEAMLVVPSLCTDPARDEEFNDWYLNTHFHDLLETPGLVQAHRWLNAASALKDNDARYLALYEIDSEDPAAVVRKILEDDRNVRIPTGRMITCIRAVYGFGTYQHIDL